MTANNSTTTTKEAIAKFRKEALGLVNIVIGGVTMLKFEIGYAPLPLAKQAYTMILNQHTTILEIGVAVDTMYKNGSPIKEDSAEGLALKMKAESIWGSIKQLQVLESSPEMKALQKDEKYIAATKEMAKEMDAQAIFVKNGIEMGKLTVVAYIGKQFADINKIVIKRGIVTPPPGNNNESAAVSVGTELGKVVSKAADAYTTTMLVIGGGVVVIGGIIVYAIAK